MVAEVAVAVTRLGFTLLLLLPLSLFGKVLPEDRADALWHLYDGGGVTIQGPSVLVRKSYKDKVSLWGNYYVDMISGASIDVQATASKYAEEREEVSVGIDYLNDRTMLGIGYTESNEDDYQAKTWRFSVSQDFFGDLTSLSLSFGYGDDTVMRNGDDTFEDGAIHQSYRFEISQILSRSLMMSLGYEAVADEGYLNNPYRSVRFADSESASGFLYQGEVYPRTRTSDAMAVRAMYYLPYRAALRTEYRYYADSWGIIGHNAELAYTHPWRERWEFDINLRAYTQSSADFYADLFPYRNAQNYLARDKELSTFDTSSLGLGVSYTFSREGFWLFSKGAINLNVDFVRFDYADFSDVTVGAAVGEEPAYQFNAIVSRIFLSLWF